MFGDLTKDYLNITPAAIPSSDIEIFCLESSDGQYEFTTEHTHASISKHRRFLIYIYMPVSS